MFFRRYYEPISSQTNQPTTTDCGLCGRSQWTTAGLKQKILHNANASAHALCCRRNKRSCDGEKRREGGQCPEATESHPSLRLDLAWRGVAGAGRAQTRARQTILAGQTRGSNRTQRSVWSGWSGRFDSASLRQHEESYIIAEVDEGGRQTTWAWDGTWDLMYWV